VRNNNFILPELTHDKVGAIFFAFLIVFCFQLSGVPAYQNSSVPDFGKYQQEQGKGESETWVSDRSGDLQRLTTSAVYDSQPSDFPGNSTRNLPIPDIYSIDLPVDDIDTHQVNHLLNSRLSITLTPARTLTNSLDIFYQLPIENVILSNLRTVVLLN